MHWLHPRRISFTSPHVDQAVVAANERSLDRVRVLAARATEQAEAAQRLIAAHIAALQQRTDRNGRG